MARRGLSPRVRGIRLRPARPSSGLGSIPACTGNPTAAATHPVEERVYPRVYGESWAAESKPPHRRGLSPRVRGIQLARANLTVVFRSIPACTGNPGPTRRLRRTSMVYPRVYGESTVARPAHQLVAGLSPRVRGIRARGWACLRQSGSIPACTGNPPKKSARPVNTWVYPRVYGESEHEDGLAFGSPGLSPRVRGILRKKVLGR